MRGLLIAVCLAPLVALADDFSGSWEVVRIIDDPSGPGWSAEIKFPKRFTIENKGKAWSGHYVDQYDYACAFALVAVLNDDRDLLLANCGTTKSPESRAPVHHIKRIGDTLHAVVVTDRPLFEWIARKRKP